MFKSKDLLYHSIAILTVIIWGTTFVSTKILINTGLSPVEILLYRFVLAYFCILTIAHRRLWANCVKDEFLLFLSGLCGGSLYFIAENTALGITLASNVSLLICTAPIITTVLSHLFYKESLRKGLLYGSLVALFGVGLVVFNGSVLLKVNPLGDFLTLVAATMWAFYWAAARQAGMTIGQKGMFYVARCMAEGTKLLMETPGSIEKAWELHKLTP